MTHFRQIYEDMPGEIPVPAELRHRRVEVILRPLDETLPNGEDGPVDALGWPASFFEKTAGRWAGEPPRREQEGDYEARQDFE